jgi:acyl-CoA hydrolase
MITVDDCTRRPSDVVRLFEEQEKEIKRLKRGLISLQVGYGRAAEEVASNLLEGREWCESKNGNVIINEHKEKISPLEPHDGYM